MEQKFAHLHLHTDYSLLDGVGKIDEYLERAKELGMSSFAVTDHGNMFGSMEFYRKAIKKGIKPIIGMEAYIAQGFANERRGKNLHLVLLAKNEVGYRNLMKLSSQAFLDGFYYKPRIDKPLLKQHSEGLIGLSACMNGEIPYYILEEEMESAQESLEDYVEIFGKEDFYIELQNNGVEGQEDLNKKLYKLAKKNDIKIVATNDVHYVYSGDDLLQDIVMCIQTGAKLNDSKRMKIKTDQLYFKSYEEMMDDFSEYEEGIKNTVEISKKCNLELDLGEFKFPKYDFPEDEKSIKTYLRTLVKKGILSRYGDLDNLEEGKKKEEIQKRVDYELDIINKMGYAEYFVVVWDFIRYAKENDIPVGPGRGSAAGSLVSYLLGITNIDPLKYGLIFERFLNPERVSMPDIDIDIGRERRQDIIEYVVNKYGQDKVAQIITFGTMKARGTIRDVGRVLGVSLKKIDKLAKLIPFGNDLDQAIKEIPKIQEIYKKDKTLQKVLNYAMRLEGQVRHSSIHAAGVIISRDPLEKEAPLYLDSKTGIVATQYQMKELEAIGLVKMDFLGLKNLTIIHRTLKYIKSTKNKDVNIDKLKLDDKSTYEALQNGDTLGVFQLESTGIKKILRKLKPTQFEDIIAVLALYRPGPLGSGMVDDYIAYKHKEREVQYPHEMLKGVLKETYGVILYQEQVMKIASIMGGFSLGEADLLRRAMGKKIPEIMEENRAKFLERAVKKGVKKDKAEEIFNLIEKFSGYGFNKSHSAAYALISYWTAYLKTNYPLEYYASIMTSEKGNLDKLAVYIREAKKKGYKVLKPDINYSYEKFKVEENGIRFGLSAIKHVGVGIVEKIISERKENGEFKDYEDFVYRTKQYGLNKKTLEALILSGGLDSLGGTKRSKHMIIESILKKISKKIDRENNLQYSLFGGGNSFNLEEIKIPDVDEFSKMKILEGEKEYIGLYFSGHPLDEYKEKFHGFQFDGIKKVRKENPYKARTIGVIRDLEKKITKKGQVMGIFMLEDYDARIKVIVFPNKYLKFSHYLVENNIVVVEGNVTIDTFKNVKEQKILANNIKSMNELDEMKRLKIYILIEPDTKNKVIKLKEILKKHSGTGRTFIAWRDDNDKKIIKLDKEYWVSPSEALIKEVEKLIGKEKIIIK
ncbi:MAG: DNA polymerase III subunit alpha [Fusobacteriota bacterium]